MPHQPHTLAGADAQREILKQRLRLALVAERHAVIEDLALPNMDWLCIGAIDYAQRLRVELDHLLHLIGRALEIAHMLPDVAQIAMHNEVACQHKRHIASRRPPLPP